MGTGNGGANRHVLSGKSLAHRQLNKRQLACLAANVADGSDEYQPTVQQLARLFGVSVPYIAIAQKLTPEKRRAILERGDSTSFGLLSSAISRFALPKPAVSPTDEQLVRLVHAVGAERLFKAIEAVV
jgi:hypothetical protein